jgi:hypothetical protein
LTAGYIELCCGPREPGKKNAQESTRPFPSRGKGGGFGGSPDSIETFLQRLRDLCQDHCEGDGQDRASRIRLEAQSARALAGELGILKVAPFAWAEIKAQIPESQIGSEHFVEQAESQYRIAKVTIPPDFGRIPAVHSHPAVHLRGEPGIREEIEFVPAAPIEYLER